MWPFQPPSGADTASSAPDADAAMERYATTGDGAAFRAVYDAVSPRLLRFLQRHTRDRALTEDLLQATWLKIHQHRGRYRTGAPVVPWAFCIARRLLMDRWKGRARHERVFDDDGQAPELADPHAIGPEAALQDVEARQAVRAALAALSEEQRAVVELVQYDGLTHAEIADFTGDSIPSIKSRIHRAYEALRKGLAKTNPRVAS